MTRTCTKMSVNYLLLIGFITIQCTIGQSIGDSRCYLAGGGSAESLTASEDLSVGSVIGTLTINGNPRLDNSGNISLSIRERDAPVSLAPGTKNLVLNVALDREGKTGPSSVYVNVICVRRHTTDPSFVIPVNVKVIDNSSHGLHWVGAPYILSISEVTVPGTRILQGARAIDEDESGPLSTIEYHVLDGPFSDYVTFVTPLEGTLVLRKPLDYETTRNFTLKLRAQDRGTPPRYTDTTLDVIIIDADDQNPKFSRESYWAELPSDGRAGELKIEPEPIRAVDQDEGILAPVRYSIMNSPESRFFEINARTGVVSLKVPLGKSDLVHTITLVIRATQVDNSDRYALTTLKISKDFERNRQFDGLSFVQTKFYARVNEDVGIGSRLMALPTNRPGRPIQYYILDREASKTFRIGPLGEVILQKPLDYENQTKYIFQVFGTDGISNATADVIIDVLDVNDWDPRFRELKYDFSIPKEVDMSRPFPLGKLEAADGDRYDKINLDLQGSYAEYFQIDPDGMLWLKPNAPNISVMHLMATATDTGLPARSSTVPITITNDSIELAQTSWASGVLGAFGAVFILFVLIVLAMCAYIHKQKEPKITGRNRVHSQDHSASSASKLVTNGSGGVGSSSGIGLGGNTSAVNGSNDIRAIKNPNLRLANPLNSLSAINNNNDLNGSGSSLSAGASTILAATLEREAQRDRDMENMSYTQSVRRIISRAAAARGGSLYDDDLEHDSISNSETNRLAWNLQSYPEDTRAMHTPNKLSWSNGGLNPLRKTDTMESNEIIDSTENAVYF